MDEAGRAPLAGPVVAAAVILDTEIRIAGLDDSKLLPREERERLFVLIQSRAVAALQVTPELVLTDFVRLAGLDCPQRNLVRGDQRSATVAAASIVAKVTRDRLMEEADGAFPVYGFRRHKGYPTREHREALERHGPCPLHRRTFQGVSTQMGLFTV